MTLGTCSVLRHPPLCSPPLYPLVLWVGPRGHTGLYPVCPVVHTLGDGLGRRHPQGMATWAKYQGTRRFLHRAVLGLCMRLQLAWQVRLAPGPTPRHYCLSLLFHSHCHSPFRSSPPPPHFLANHSTTDIATTSVRVAFVWLLCVLASCAGFPYPAPGPGPVGYPGYPMPSYGAPAAPAHQPAGPTATSAPAPAAAPPASRNPFDFF